MSPFHALLGVGAGRANGPAVVSLRARCAKGGEGKIEWLLPNAARQPAKPKSVPFMLKAGDWQVVAVNLPAEGPLGIVRVYLPAQEQRVEIDWIEIKAGGRTQRWGF